jgi:hypothetical protein
VPTIVYEKSYVYVIRGENRLKIGFSIDPDGRFKSLQTNSHDDLEIVYRTELVANYRKIEKVAHKLLKSFKTKGEWFRVSSDIGIAAVKEAVEIVTQQKYEEVLGKNKKYTYDKVTISISGSDKELLLKLKSELEIEARGLHVSLSQAVVHLLRLKYSTVLQASIEKCD